MFNRAKGTGIFADRSKTRMINRIFNTKIKERLIFILIAFFVLITVYSSIKETITKNVQLGLNIPNNIVNSTVVALDGIINPNSVIAATAVVEEKIQNGEGVEIRDVFRRSTIQSGNSSTQAFFQLYDTKAGINNGDPIADNNTGADIQKYLRFANRSSLDLEASQYVAILMYKGTSPQTVADFIENTNKNQFVPIIRLGAVDLGDEAFPFNLKENANEMIDFFSKVGEILMSRQASNRAVISLGPNEPHTGDNLNRNLTAMGLAEGSYDANYRVMVQRQNQAASALQSYRVQNGGVFWFAPAIFNGTEPSPVPERDYAYDIYNHLYVNNGDTDTERDYWKRQSIDSNLFDVMLVNVYSEKRQTAYGFYETKGLKEYVDKRNNLTTIVSEFGSIDPDILIEDLKDDFAALYKDPKIEGINWFRALKDKPSLPPAPTAEQSASIEDFIKYLEQTNAISKKTTKITSWLNTPTSAALYDISNTSGGSSGTLKPSGKGGLNEGDNVAGGDGTMDHATNVGLKGYSLGIAYKPADAEAAIGFINRSISKGFIPIIRLCIKEGGESCGFNLSGGNSSSLVEFYNKVTAGAQGTFIGIVGPNEPKSEAAAFSANVPDTVKAANDAITKINKNGKMLAAPAAFNLESTGDPYDAGYDWSKFDVLVGNAYNRSFGTADSIASGAISFAKGKGLKVIITETGRINESGAEDFVKSAAALCSKVDGFLMFRVSSGSADGSYDSKPTAYSDDQLKQIASACSGGGSTSNPAVQGVSINKSSIIAAVDNGGGGGTPTTTTAPACTGGVADDKVIFLGDSLTNELVNKNFSTSKNLGFPGASTQWLVPGAEPANDKSAQLNEALSDSKYTHILVMFGTNDCGGLDVNKFQSNLETIIKNIQDKNKSITIIISTIPKAHTACTDVTIDSFNSAISDVAQKTGVKLRELGGSLFSDADLRSGDDRHLTDAAYTKIANITKQALGASCSENSTTTPYESTGGSGAGAYALACGTEEDKPASFYQDKNAAALRVKCEGNNCTTKLEQTIDIEAPFKLFSSTTATGTVRLRYTPVSQVAAASSQNGMYDALNMFAGEMKVNGKSYPFPGLGSAINSASKILQETMTERDPTIQLESSIGASTQVTSLKLEGQQKDGLTVDVLGGSNTGLFSTNQISVGKEGNQLKSVNEATLCVDGVCTNNYSGLADASKNILPYDPSIAYPSYIAPKACSTTNMKYINNLENYITGPELVVKDPTTEYTGTTQDVCWLYSRRNLNSTTPKTSGDGVKTCGYIFDNQIFPNSFDINATSGLGGKPLRDITETTYDPTLGRNVTTTRTEYGDWTCKELFDGVANGSDGIDEDGKYKDAKPDGGKLLPDCDFDNKKFNAADPKGKIPADQVSGYCEIPESYKSCLKYEPQPSDKIYIHSSNFASVSKVQIPNIYAAIYGLYDRLQTMMSQRNMKFVFPENYGVKIKVNSKIRDANESINKTDYDFSKMYDSFGTMPKLIDNTIPLASQNSTKTQFQYYDNLGYLDILQEYIVAYANEQVLIGDHLADNPFKDSADNPFPNRTTVLLGGLSNLSLSNPILTCDQVEICKKFTFGDLKEKYGEKMAYMMCPLSEKLPSEAKKNCVTYLEDTKYDDNLKTTLCSRGFNVAEGCHFQCSVNNTPTDPGDITPTGKYVCPTEKKVCLQGPHNTSLPSTHTALNAIDIAGTELYAPFDGKIVHKDQASWCKSGGIAGGRVFYEGQVEGKTVRLFFYHINIATITKQEGSDGTIAYAAGEHIASTTSATDPEVTDRGCLGSPRHTHVELANSNNTPNQPGDIASLFKIFGCNMAINADRACTNYTTGLASIDTSDKIGEIVQDTTTQQVDNLLSCFPGQNNPGDGQDPGGTKFNNVFELIEKVSDLTGTNKYFLASELSIEGGQALNKSVGQYITQGGAVLTGNPSDKANENPNGAGAVGPYQYICRTWLSYGYPKTATNLPCEPWNSTSLGRYYDQVLRCVQSLGMDFKDGDVLDPAYMGTSICAAAIQFNFSATTPLEQFNVADASSFSSSNIYWRAAQGNFCGNVQACLDSAEGKWYADSAWGRANYFKKFWDDYKSGKQGSNCFDSAHNQNAYLEWYYYNVGLGIQCVNRGYANQCNATTPSQLDAFCHR